MWLFKRKVKKKLGLALGSGGAKGMAHLGALKAFEEEGIEFDIITGTSIGSIVGASMAYGYGYKKMFDLVYSIDLSGVKSRGLLTLIKQTDSENIVNIANQIFGGDIQFSDLKKPFACVSVDLVTGEEVVIKSGSVCRAVAASSSMSPAFTPLVEGNMHLVDGAYLNSVPADVARQLGADVVIGIDLSSKNKRSTDSLKLMDVLLTTVKISMKDASYKGYTYSDYMLQPDLAEYPATKFDKMDEIFKIGYDTAKAGMNDIKRILSENRIMKFPKNKGEK